MEALLTHKSLNVSYPIRSDLPVYNFWNQIKNEQGYYIQFPDNLE